MIAVVLTTLVLYTVYNIVDETGHKKGRSRVEALGEIETPAKKILNGYLGVFFRFKYLGNINWLILPLLIWFLVTVKKRERWQTALLFVWLVTTIFISVKGYANPRYQLTLFPLTSGMVLLLLWQFLEGKKRVIKILCLSLVGIISLFNIIHYVDDYNKYWKLRVSRQDSYFPSQLVEYLNTSEDINDQSKVFTINQPFFFYYTGKKGIDYLSPFKRGIWLEASKTRGNMNAVYRLLKKKYMGRYILLKSSQERYFRWKTLAEFLHCQCKLVMEDHGRRLYRVRDIPLEQELRLPQYEEIPVWKPGGTTLKEISPHLIRFSRRGIFKFNPTASKGRKRIVVRNRKAKKGERRISFGYEFISRSIDREIPEGKYVHLIVKAAASTRLVRNKNYIMISDYTAADKKWEAEKTYFEAPFVRTYIVSKRVRPGTSRLLTAFRFEPESPDDRLLIEDVRIFVSEKPL